MSRYISEKEYKSKMARIKLQNKKKERIYNLKQEQKKFSGKPKLPSASKLILIGMILMCFEIVLFCEYMSFALSDTSFIYALIGIPVGLAPIIWGYYSKSKAENTEGGIVYETTMHNLNAPLEPSNSEDDSNETNETINESDDGAMG